MEMCIINLVYFIRLEYVEVIIESGGFVGDFKKINEDV